ncbi:MAG: hypothetical protein ABIK42_04155, partial [candidate division WOR-3 bacterium]
MPRIILIIICIFGGILTVYLLLKQQQLFAIFAGICSIGSLFFVLYDLFVRRPKEQKRILSEVKEIKRILMVEVNASSENALGESAPLDDEETDMEKESRKKFE